LEIRYVARSATAVILMARTFSETTTIQKRADNICKNKSDHAISHFKILPKEVAEAGI